MSFSVTILGTGAATPTLGRHCSAQVVTIHGFPMLVDCGESTQTQLRYCHQRLQSFSVIFISHLHGDHLWGLPGLLASMHLCGRTEPVDVFAPAGLQPTLEMLFKVSDTHLNYDLRIHELTSEEPVEVFRNSHCFVTAFPLQHTVPTYGFLFTEEKPFLNIKREAMQRYCLTPEECRAIKLGANLERADLVVPNSELVMPPVPPRRYAYCCDTAYTEQIVPAIQGADLLCLESTFDANRADLATQRCHLTASQAAQLASAAGVQRLLLTHFSARYKDVSPLLDEARAIFPNTFAAAEASTVELPPHRG